MNYMKPSDILRFFLKSIGINNQETNNSKSIAFEVSSLWINFGKDLKNLLLKKNKEKSNEKKILQKR